MRLFEGCFRIVINVIVQGLFDIVLCGLIIKKEKRDEHFILYRVKYLAKLQAIENCYQSKGLSYR